MALQVIAEAQKTGGTCAFVDAEHALDPTYAKKLGVNTTELLISQPDTGEQASAKVLDIESVSTGSLSLDLALGIGGLPKSRIVEIYGPESSGKTTLALQVIAEAQKTGGTCAFVDAEHAVDPTYAKKLGVQTTDLLISQPDTGEQALESADTLVRSGAVSVLVIDSA